MSARIAGVNIPENKRLVISLTYIYGVGPTRAKKICDLAGLDHNKKAKDLTDSQISSLIAIIDREFKVEGDLKTEVLTNIKKKKDRGCYQGVRHRKGLPVHGQRTKTNARTRKGKKKLPVANKKKVAK